MKNSVAAPRSNKREMTIQRLQRPLQHELGALARRLDRFRKDLHHFMRQT